MQNPTSEGQHRARWPARATLSVVYVVLPVLLFSLLTLHDWVQARGDSVRHADQAAELAAERAFRLIQIGQQALARAEDAIGNDRWTPLQGQARRNAVVAQLRRIEQGQPAGLTVFAVRGDWRDSLGRPGGDLAVPTRLHEIPGEPRSMLMAPGDGSLAGELFLARDRPGTGGTNAAAAVVAFSPDALAALWDPPERQGCASILVAQDGSVLAWQGELTDAMREALSRDGAGGRAGTGAIRTDLGGFGSAAVVAWRRVGDLPLLVAHVVPRAPGLPAAGQGMLVNLALSALVGLVFLIVGRRVARADRANAANLARLEASAAELRAEIGRREAAEEGLRNAQRLEGLGRLTGGVAHDFNNLLTAILGTARALERYLGPRSDERSQRLIGSIVSAVQRGSRLNASLLAFARRQPLTLATVDANALLREFLPLLRRALDETITVELALDERLPTCLADAAQLEAALLNLAINARDAMTGGGTIRIATRRAWLQEQALAGNPEAQPGPYVAIEIRDTGEGMAPEVRERAFEPFFTTKPAGQGTGLGLSQVFGFVRQIGGHVAIQSAPGRGTTVTLYLPLGSALEEARGGTVPASAPQVPVATAAGISVLVVEDEPAVRAVAMDILREAGFDVLAAPDGQTALALLREGARVDILFSDIVMPGGVSGVELAREAQALYPEMGVLLASGYAADALEKWGGVGEFELIGKPYDTEALLGRLAVLAARVPVAPR